MKGHRVNGRGICGDCVNFKTKVTRLPCRWCRWLNNVDGKVKRFAFDFWRKG